MTDQPSIDNRILVTESPPNPYAPTSPETGSKYPTYDQESLFTPYRLDGWAIAAISASVLDSVSIGLLLSQGTGVIRDPILGPLAARSLLWIPVYRLAVPLLIPLMPKVCRQSFAVFYLAVGLLFSINNFSGHYAGWFVFVDSFGLYVSLALCLIPATQAFGVYSMRAGDFARSLRTTLAWIAFAFMIQAAFLGISRSI